MSNGTITFSNDVGRFDLDVTTFQMAVLFAWNQRPEERVSYENLRLATELPGEFPFQTWCITAYLIFCIHSPTDPELRRTLWSLVAFPKLKKQVVLMDPIATQPKDFAEHTCFWINNDFAIVKNGKVQRRGKVNSWCNNTITHTHT